MNFPTSCLRLVPLLAVLALTGLSAPPPGTVNPFPPINSPAMADRHPGKFIWADLFTTDPVGATAFYTGLFGWTADAVSENGKSYTVFRNDSRPVAGLAPRSPSATKRPSRWIGYIAVTDLAATLQLVLPAGGKVRAEAREFPDRGSQAIITDIENAPVGLLHSSSGDVADTEPKPGDWNWFELYARHPPSTAAFYQQILHYEMTLDSHTDRSNDYLLASDGLARAGVAPLPTDGDSKPGWLGVVRVADIDASLILTVKLGGTVRLAARAAAFGSRFAIITDPTGGTLGLVQYVDNANPANRP